MRNKITIPSVLALMVFSIIILLPSCILFDDFLKRDDIHGNKIVFKNETSTELFFEWRKTANPSEISMDYPISVNGFHEYQSVNNVYNLLQETINTNFILKVSNGTKTIDNTNLELQSFPDSIHSITNLNSWEKDFYVYEGDTFDILRFTFTDKDFK